VLRSVTRLLTTKLKLRVNSEKSAVARPWERKFLGFSFTNHQQAKRRLAPKAVARFKERIRELTSRTRRSSLARMVHDLAEDLRGWIGYFGRCETPEVLDKLERWLRHRLRSMVWKQWKRGTTSYRELRKRGIDAQEAAQTAGSSDGPWHLANTPALKLALSNAYFALPGLPELAVGGLHRTSHGRNCLPGREGHGSNLLTYRGRDSSLGFRTELENRVGDAKGKGTSGHPTRPKEPMHRSGAHCLVVARKRGNSRGAKGAGHPSQGGVNGKPEELLVLMEGGRRGEIPRAYSAASG